MATVKDVAALARVSLGTVSNVLNRPERVLPETRQRVEQAMLDLNRIATLNGYPVSSSYTGSFWKLAPGTNAIRLYAEPNAQASVTIQSYSAWE